MVLKKKSDIKVSAGNRHHQVVRLEVSASGGESHLKVVGKVAIRPKAC